MENRGEYIGGLVYGLISEICDKTWTTREINDQISKNIKCNKNELECALNSLQKNGIIIRRGSDGWCMPTGENEVDEVASAFGDRDQSADSIARSLESTHLKEREDPHHTEVKCSPARSRFSGEQGDNWSFTEQSRSLADSDQTSPKQPISGIEHETVPKTSTQESCVYERREVKQQSNAAQGFNQQSELCIDPEVNAHIDPLNRIIDLFKSGKKDLSPAKVSQIAKLGQSKKESNRYLYHLERKGMLIKSANEDNSKPFWNMNGTFDVNKITERMILEWAGEIAKKSIGKGQPVHHHHHHEHSNMIQVGDNNKIFNVKDAQNFVEEPAERKAENSVKD